MTRRTSIPHLLMREICRVNTPPWLHPAVAARAVMPKRHCTSKQKATLISKVPKACSLTCAIGRATPAAANAHMRRPMPCSHPNVVAQPRSTTRLLTCTPKPLNTTLRSQPSFPTALCATSGYRRLVIFACPPSCISPPCGPVRALRCRWKTMVWLCWMQCKPSNWTQSRGRYWAVGAGGRLVSSHPFALFQGYYRKGTAYLALGKYKLALKELKKVTQCCVWVAPGVLFTRRAVWCCSGGEAGTQGQGRTCPVQDVQV